MGWIGLSLLLGLVALGVVHYRLRMPMKMWSKSDDYTIYPIMFFIIGLIFIGMFGGMYSSIEDGHIHRGEDTSHCEEWVNSWDIVSAIREKNTTSSFILGTGGSRIVDRYYVYQVESGGLMLTDYNAHRTYVVEQDGQPAYERVDYICPQPVYDFLWWSSGNTHRNKSRYGTLYVPEGTILRKFEM